MDQTPTEVPTLLQPRPQYSFLLNIWVTWLVLTVIYTSFYFFGAIRESNQIGDTTAISFAGHIAGLFGIFVPLSLGNAFFIMLIGPALIVVLLLAEYIAKKLHIAPKAKILYNLVILFLFTLAVDLILFQSWPSGELLFYGYLPHICC